MDVFIFGAISNALDGEDSSSPTDTTPTDLGTDPDFGSSTDSNLGITAADVVDFQEIGEPGSTSQFRSLYSQLGHALALGSFADGYGAGLDPSAEEVFDEFLSRCQTTG